MGVCIHNYSEIYAKIKDVLHSSRRHRHTELYRIIQSWKILFFFFCEIGVIKEHQYFVKFLLKRQEVVILRALHCSILTRLTETVKRSAKILRNRLCKLQSRTQCAKPYYTAYSLIEAVLCNKFITSITTILFDGFFLFLFFKRFIDFLVLYLLFFVV